MIIIFGTNALAYLDSSLVMKKKKLYNFVNRAESYKHFRAVIYDRGCHMLTFLHRVGYYGLA
jgi:hypothetical protein